MSNELGAIRPGYLADLVYLDGNPLDDIGNTGKSTVCWQEGVFCFETIRTLYS